MRSIFFILLCCLLFAFSAQASQISGEYLETRSADVYTGPCFANSEVGLVGKEAIVAWHVSDGSWNGIALNGLNVVGIARASGTLGDPFHNPYPAEAILVVDNRATESQRQALISFAKEMGSDLLRSVSTIHSATIDMDVDPHGFSSMSAGNFAAIQTRSIGPKDHLCGNEETYYPPLTDISHAMPAVSLLDQYQGSDLGVTWTRHEKRNAFSGTFSR